MAGESLPRAHSERFGWLDKSNWRDLESRRNLQRVDPALREIIQLLNRKGYKTYSSCSGGHQTLRRGRWRQQHLEGYIAFSPPSRVAVKLYFMLQGRNEHFQLSTQVGILDEDNNIDQTAFSELRWQLQDDRRHRNQYYKELFNNLKQAIEKLPSVDSEEDSSFLKSFFGHRNVKRGFHMIDEQAKRFH